MKPRVTISLSSPKPSHDWSFGKKALEILYGADADLQPDRVGRDDVDFRKKLPCARVDDLESLWAKNYEDEEPYGLHEGFPNDSIYSLLWKRHRPLRAHGSFNFASYWKIYNKNLPSRLKFRADYASHIDYYGLFEAWCALYEPRHGYLHFLTKEVLKEERHEIVRSSADLAKIEMEISRGISVSYLEDVQRAVRDFHEGFLGPLDDERTFDLGCINFFSSEMVGKNTIDKLKAAGIHVSPFANGHFVNLSSDIAELQGDFDGFVKRRVLAKSIMGPKEFVLQM